MHVVGDFLKRQIAPLQQRARLCCWFTDSNDIGRVQRGPGTDLSWEELEVLVKGITGESFVLESLILPEGISTLCDDAGLRTAILATLPTLDESGVAVRQTGVRDPHRGIRISDVSARGPQTASVAPNAPARASRASAAAPHPLDKGKGATGGSSTQAALGCRRKRGDAVCAASTDRSFRTPRWGRGGRHPEASKDYWWDRGGRLPGPGRAEARQSSATTTIRFAATTTTTTVGPAATNSTWG
jgi:hypothetical protein